jgi:hypothetical protein
MSSTAGARTGREGRKRVKDGLLTPQVLAIIVFTVALEVGAVVGVNALARALGVHTNKTLTALTLGALLATTLLVLVGVVAVLSGGINWITGSKAEG